MVEVARQRGLPWVWVHADTGAVDWSGMPQGPLRDPMVADLEHLLTGVPEAPSPSRRLRGDRSRSGSTAVVVVATVSTRSTTGSPG
jgi:hypothetical protein